jgi:hypothetical protein
MWPKSDMRVRVTVRPNEPEGPRAIEVLKDPSVSLPSTPHPVFGACFVDAKLFGDWEKTPTKRTVWSSKL